MTGRATCFQACNATTVNPAIQSGRRGCRPTQQDLRFQLVLAGLVMTADWMGSDVHFHTVLGDDDRPQAARNLLDSTRWSGWHSGSQPEAILGNYKPRSAQISMLSLPLSERLTVIEAPTGSGKTEASLI